MFYLIYAEFSGALLGAAALIALRHKAIGARHHLSGAGCHVISKQTLLRTVLPLRHQHRVQQAAALRV